MMSLLPKTLAWLALPSLILTVALPQSGCIRVSTDPIRVEPIYIEVTINHRIQRELEDIFGDIDRASETMDYQPLEAEDER
ncbi:MAG: hypothetical protein JJU20_11470 [Opitutales bacterium]|nr:hypothetical protein [Opitutales bacterium]